MTRIALGILLALLIPACHHDDEHWNDDVEFAVDNLGTSTVQVEVRHDYYVWPYDGVDHEDFYEVAGGEYRVERFPDTDRLKVRIYRKSDRLLLFSDTYYPEDFYHHHRITVSVDP